MTTHFTLPISLFTLFPAQFAESAKLETAIRQNLNGLGYGG